MTTRQLCQNVSCSLNLSGRERVEYLINLYKEQLKSAGGIKYVRTFALEAYTNYLQLIRKIAKEYNLSARKVEMALWAFDRTKTQK